MKINPQSPEWLAIAAAIEARIEKLTRHLKTDLDEKETAKARGALRELGALLAEPARDRDKRSQTVEF